MFFNKQLGLEEKGFFQTKKLKHIFQWGAAIYFQIRRGARKVKIHIRRAQDQYLEKNGTQPKRMNIVSHSKNRDHKKNDMNKQKEF